MSRILSRVAPARTACDAPAADDDAAADGAADEPAPGDPAPGRPPRRAFRAGRRVQVLAAAAIAAALAGCGGGDGYYYDDCNPNLHPAVAVSFVDARSGRSVLVDARGTAYDGRVVETMTSPDPNYSVDGRTSVLEAGFGRPGVYDVSIATASGERFDWVGIQVAGDACGPFTVQLQAPVQLP